MAKRRPKEPFAARPFAVEYYKQLIHRNPIRRGFCMTIDNAVVKAGEHLDRGHAVKAVIVKRKTGLVIMTRLNIGGHTINQAGDYENGKIKIEETLPELEDAE